MLKLLIRPHHKKILKRGDVMLQEKLVELDKIIAGIFTGASKNLLHTLLDEMKSLIGWHDGIDGIKYAVDTSTGEVILKLDADGRIMYQAENPPPLSVLFA